MFKPKAGLKPLEQSKPLQSIETAALSRTDSSSQVTKGKDWSSYIRFASSILLTEKKLNVVSEAGKNAIMFA